MEQIGLEGVFKTEAFASGLAKYTSGLNKAVSDTGSAGGFLGNALASGVKIGVTALAGLAVAAVTAGAAVGATITKMVFDAATLGDTYATLSGQTGITAERLQELAYAGTLLDVPLETITSGLRFLTRNMYSARTGTGVQADAFKTLKIAVLDANGNLRDSDVVFGEVIDKLGKMDNPTEADAIAMALMGRSAMELNPLIKAGSKALATYSADAHTMGAVVSEEGILALDQFKDRFDALKLSMKGISASLALAFLPAFKDIEDAVRGTVMDIQSAMSTGDWGVVVDDIAETLAQVMTNTSKFIPKFVGKFQLGISWIQKMLKAKLPTFIKNGADIVAALIKGIGPALTSLGMGGIDIAGIIIQSLRDSWPALQEAGRTLMSDLGQGIEAGLAAIGILDPNHPLIGNMVNFLIGKAEDLASQLKTWVDNVPWGELSRSVAAAISGQPWSTIGLNLGGLGQNLWGAIHDVLFGHPVTKFNITTHEAETIMTGGIDWGALTVALATAFDNAVIGALSGGLHIGDVSNLAGLRDEWTNIGIQYGKVAGAGMAPQFWSELWKAINSDQTSAKGSLQDWGANLGIQAGKTGGVGSLQYIGAELGIQFRNGFIQEWDKLWKSPMNFQASLDFWKSWLQTSLNVWGPFFGTFLQTYFTGPFNQMVDDATVAWIKLLALWNSTIGQIIGTQIPLPPLPGSSGPGIVTGGGPDVNNTPSVPVVPVRGPGHDFGGSSSVSSAKTVNNNITVVNPTAEPASTSVSSTLRKLNYFGVV